MILKADIIGKEVNGSNEVLLRKGSVINKVNQYVRYKGSIWSGNKDIYYTYTTNIIEKIPKIINNNLKNVLVKKTYEFTINSKFFSFFIDDTYNEKNRLIEEIQESLEREFKAKAEAEAEERKELI